MAWTAAQQQAIESRGSGLIVSAAAGSGKTSVLVERLLRILTEEDPEKRVPADRMIVVTFTNDAAAEMKARLSQALDLQIQQNPENRWLYQQQILLQSAQICTISSFCFYLIRNHFTHGGITSGFRILNDTESRMIAAKSADQVLNQWHQTRPEDMKLLWDAFCEKNDTPLEQILLQFHQFLASVPFRDQWETAALRSFSLPVETNFYHLTLSKRLLHMAENAAQLADNAVDLAADLYESPSENTVLPWIEEDRSCIQQMLQHLKQQETDAEKILSAYLACKQQRGRKPFPKKKKSITDPEVYAQVKQIRDQYVRLEQELADNIAAVFPYEETDIRLHQRILPLILEMEQDLSDTVWAEKVQRNVLGFEDGERLALELLSSPGENGKIQPSPLAREMAEYYQIIMIDEYQDSNNKQDDIFKLLSRNCIDPLTGELRYGDNVFLVGDVKQSIYRFRLANPQNFMHAVSGAVSGSGVCRHIALNRNFRSTPGVLRFVNFVCGNLMSPVCGDVAYTKEEALEPGSALGTLLQQEEQTVHIAVLQETSENDTPVQMLYVLRQIQNMLQRQAVVIEKNGTKRPCRYSDFCILVRNNIQCQEFSHLLERHGIPVQSPEEKGYLQAREISILLDMLRILDNPLLDTSLAAVMLSPMFWFTAEELTRIRLLQSEEPLYITLRLAADSDAAALKDAVLQKKCSDLLETLQKLRQISGMVTLESLIRKIYDMTDFLSVMQLTENGEKKRANLNLLLQYARQYEENAEASRSGLSGFLRYIDWLIDSGNDFQQTTVSAGAENAVAIKTMHRSKGLEFPFVFLGYLETPFSTEEKRKNALFSDQGMAGFCIKDPKTYTRAKTLPFAVIAQENEARAKSEELRLLYVAMTRAKQQLFLPLCTNRIQTKTHHYLEEFAMSISQSGELPVSLVQSAGSMAHWIWMCLVLLHPEQLHAIIPFPPQQWKTPAWSEGLNLCFEDTVPEISEEKSEEAALPAFENAHLLQELQSLTAFAYRSPDVKRESLLSVSALQETRQQRPSVWERPRFLQEQTTLTGAERGTAIHTFFQYADFPRAQADFQAELHRLCKNGFLTTAQAEVVTPKIAAGFFSSSLYKRLQKSSHVLREQKFLVQCSDLQSYPRMREILDFYDTSDSMIKGIIDLAFQEPDGFVLVDYKTDFVTDPDLLLQNYQEQLLIYRAALECITGQPVKEAWIYSTHLQMSIPISMEVETQ